MENIKKFCYEAVFTSKNKEANPYYKNVNNI